jgi:hypothetical protein
VSEGNVILYHVVIDTIVFAEVMCALLFPLNARMLSDRAFSVTLLALEYFAYSPHPFTAALRRAYKLYALSCHLYRMVALLQRLRAIRARQVTFIRLH